MRCKLMQASLNNSAALLPLCFHCACWRRCTPPAAWLRRLPPTPPRLAPPRSPVRYCRKVDRRAMTFPDPVEGMEHLMVDNNGVK